VDADLAHQIASGISGTTNQIAMYHLEETLFGAGRGAGAAAAAAPVASALAVTADDVNPQLSQVLEVSTI
jgi:hypothetical protein